MKITFSGYIVWWYDVIFVPACKALSTLHVFFYLIYLIHEITLLRKSSNKLNGVETYGKKPSALDPRMFRMVRMFNLSVSLMF